MGLQPESRRLDELKSIVSASKWFMPALHAVRSINLKSWCIGAGAVRNLVWDHLHGYESPSPLSDIDVAYYDPDNGDPDLDHDLQEQLRRIEPSMPWEVTNQAFVHTRFEACFGHPVAQLGSIEEAVGSWPEYATSVGVSLTGHGKIEVIAPYGLEDLFELRIRRNPSRVSLETYRLRVAQKQYSIRWPKVTIVPC
jgi:hypothetical protein